MKHWLHFCSIRIVLSVVCAASLNISGVAAAPRDLPVLSANVVEATPSISTTTATRSTATASRATQTAPLTQTATASSDTQTVPPSPKMTPSPTAHAEESPTATVVATSAPSALPSAAPALSAPAVSGRVVPLRVNLREGPGANYPIRASYARGSAVAVLGRTQNGAWLRVVMADDRAGWIATNCVELDVAPDSLPVVDGTSGDMTMASGAYAQRPIDPAAAVPATSGVDADAPIANISDGPKGVGVIIVSATDLHVAPGVRTEVVQRLAQDEQVKLLGQARGAWVRVQPFGAVVPGWVYAAHLKPLPGTIAGTPLPATTASLTTTASVSATLFTPTARPTAVARMVDATPEAAMDETAIPPVRLPLEIAVTVVGSTTTAAPTTEASLGVAGLHVAIVTVFGDVLAEAITPPNGRVRFDLDVAPDVALAVQIAALGLRTSISSDRLTTGHAELTVTLPDVTD